MACLRVSGGFRTGGGKSVLSSYQSAEKESLHSCLGHGNPCHLPKLLKNHNPNSQRLRVVVNSVHNRAMNGASFRSNHVELAIPSESITRLESFNPRDIGRKERVPVDDDDDQEEKEITSQRLDKWMRDSVTQIVSNIEEAPFLVQIYSDEINESSSCGCPVGTVIEKAVEGWPVIKQRWERGECPTPNGIILVEELKSCGEEKSNNMGINGHGHGNGNGKLHSTKIWGVLIQGKGVNGSACYILKTCRVQSSLGFCTHFYVFRVDCFVESAETQLKKVWLQR